VLLSLVPRSEPLLAEVSIQNDDIGFVHEGQAVRVKLSTYPFQKYGTLDGVVRTVIADSSRRDDAGRADVAEERRDTQSGALSFKAMVELKNQSLQRDEASFPLAAGMQLSAEVIEGKRTVLEYLLSPVQKVKSEAGMER
jgi:HlyD family secretion protein